MNCVSVDQARSWKSFLSPSCFVFTKMDLQQWPFSFSFFLFFFPQGKSKFQLHFSGFPLRNEKQMVLHTGKMQENV